ncbi:hypothetical protein EPUS_01623 [Endocarpon pusillum Z07020]|uniref:Uncharacterized protein n=1 Tax=Endocarpon pusillum (strain Z07020 / HMAS-L-300199) TaxID=1263415 RepID=U1GTQ3_ENDPU|nr:uncharacterized protein EPUS_01623 [Endocarpon pusillum Z07020]ERF75793.1 hypothetical protein EPUS_01623 [Endocarpon pusillum Z07020]
MSVGDENETCHLPVHAACLELCGQHQRGHLPLSAESLQDSSMGVLSRLAFEYEEQYQDFCGDKLHDGMLMLKADYGALECYEWMDDDQMPTMDDFGAFVYHASCTNKVFDMNPMTIKAKQLTDFVLSMLQPLLLPRPTAGQGHAREITHCPGARLPQELLNMIESYASSSFSNADPEPSRILPQSWWREALINKKMLPWLWDLDVDMIRTKDSKPPKNWFGASGTWVEWDWELLVRKLAQTDFYKDIGIHTAGEGPALALKNRRRIFLIMDDLVRTLPGQPRMKESINWQDTDCPDWLLICHLVNT